MLSLLSNSRLSKYLAPFNNTKQERKSQLKLSALAQVGARALCMCLPAIFYCVRANEPHFLP